MGAVSNDGSWAIATRGANGNTYAQWGPQVVVWCGISIVEIGERDKSVFVGAPNLMKTPPAIAFKQMMGTKVDRQTTDCDCLGRPGFSVHVL
jgi:hypothetical protein